MMHLTLKCTEIIPHDHWLNTPFTMRSRESRPQEPLAL